MCGHAVTINVDGEQRSGLAHSMLVHRLAVCLLRVEREVAEAVGEQHPRARDHPLENVRMASDAEGRTGIEEGKPEAALRGAWEARSP